MARTGIFSVAVALALALCGCSGDGGDAPPEEQPLAELQQGHKPNAAEPANVVGGFSIQLPDFTLGPGEEQFPCWIFPLELTGDSFVVGGGKLTPSPGLHHGNVTTRPVTGSGMRECPTAQGGAFGGEAADILEGGAVLFGSSTQIVGTEWQSFPDGMGYPIAEGYEIVARMHYLNTSAETLVVAPSYEWFTIDESSLEHTLGPFAWVLQDWEIPPLSTLTVEATCSPPRDMHVVNAMPHMHALGTEFFGGFIGGDYDGQRWLDSKGYDPENGVVTQYTPAMDLSIADQVTFGCTWQNTFDKVIGEGTGDNEMCILFGYAYPYEHAYSGQANPNGGCILIAPPEPG